MVAKRGWNAHRVAFMRCFLLCLLIIALLASLHGQELWERLPRQDKAVHDFAEVIDPATESQLESRLRQAYQTTATPIVVVALRSLEGGQIDDFANRLYEEWGIGTQPENRGALFLVAIQDRAMRLEVGYGTEPVITDAYASRLISARATPRFRAGDYSGGIAAVVDGLIAPLETGQTPPVPRERDGANNPGLLFLFFMFAFVVASIAANRRRRASRRGRYRGRRYAGPFIGGGFGGGSRGSFGGGGFGGFGGGFSGGGGASGGW